MGFAEFLFTLGNFFSSLLLRGFNSLLTAAWPIQVLVIVFLVRVGYGLITSAVTNLRVVIKARSQINALELWARNSLSQLLTYLGLGWMTFALILVVWLFTIFGGQEGLVISSGLIGLALLFALGTAFLSGWLLTHEYQELSPTHPITKKVHELSQRAGIKPPRFYLANDSTPNAFFCGLGRGRLVLHEGFLTSHWTDAEREAVLAHEIGHRLNGDIALASFTIAIVLAIQWIGRAMIRLGEWMLYTNDDDDDRGKSVPVALGCIAAGFLISTVLTGITILAKLAVSRQREFLADRMGIALIGNPQAFADLFRKLKNAPPSSTHNALQAALFINAANLKGARGGVLDFLSGLSSTHPELDDRIAQTLELVPGQ